ncbi:hypothetical protein JB92DRAFT_3125421 [Gautieria morchelliformis]|nr:hypothetical protein JB92DRAFT_3125421 [Gautieria morchelliformis]
MDGGKPTSTAREDTTSQQYETTTQQNNWVGRLVWMSLLFYPVRAHSVLSLVDELCGGPLAGGRNKHFPTPPQFKVPVPILTQRSSTRISPPHARLTSAA